MKRMACWLVFEFDVFGVTMLYLTEHNGLLLWFFKSLYEIGV